MNRTKTRTATLLLAAACFPLIGVVTAEAQPLPVTKAFRLENVDPLTISEMFRQLYPQVQSEFEPGSRSLIVRGRAKGKRGELEWTLEPDSKSLIVRGSAQNLDEVETALKAIDVPRATSALPKMPSDPNDARIKNAIRGGVRGDLNRFVGQSPLDSTLSKLQNDYRSHEQEAHQLASQAYGAAQQSVQAALQTEGLMMGGSRNDRASPQATPQLREQVTKAFEARQQLLRVELEQFRQRLARIEQTLEAREQLKQTIIDQRIKELLNPALEWEPATEAPMGQYAPAVSSIPLNAPAIPARTAKAPLTQTEAPKDVPLGEPTKLVTAMRERYKLALDRLEKYETTNDDVARVINELDEAEFGAYPNSLAVRKASLERWLKLKHRAEELVKQGLAPQSVILEVEAGLLRAQERMSSEGKPPVPASDVEEKKKTPKAKPTTGSDAQDGKADSKSAQRPMRQVVMLQEQVNRAMDELADNVTTIDKVIPLVKELHEAEALGKRPNSHKTLEQLSRWQKLKQIAVDVAKRGSAPAAKLKEVEKALQAAIDQATQLATEGLPQLLMTPQAFRKAVSETNEAIRKAKEPTSILANSEPGMTEQELRRRYPSEWQNLDSVRAAERPYTSQIDGLNVRIRLAILERDRLCAESAEVGKANSSEHARRIAESEQRVKRLEHVAELYRQAMAPPDKRYLPVVVEGTDVENEAVVEERLWNYVGVELRLIGVDSGNGFNLQPSGLMVTGVRDNSPAQKAGIRFRDFIHAVDWFGVDSAADVWDVFVETAPPREVTFRTLRDDKLQEVKVDLTNADNAVGQPKSSDSPTTAASRSDVPSSDGAKPIGEVLSENSPKIDLPSKGAAPNPGASAAPSDELWQELGMRVKPVGRERVTTQGSLRGGLEVKEIRKESPANAAGLKVGDILVGAGQWETLTEQALLMAPRFGNAEKGFLKVFMLRDDRVISGKIPVKDTIFSFFLGFVR